MCIKYREDIWENEAKKLAKNCKESFPGETVNGPIMYRFNNELAASMPITPESIQKVHRLIAYLKDNKNDHIFMMKYLELLEQQRKLQRENTGQGEDGGK